VAERVCAEAELVCIQAQCLAVLRVQHILAATAKRCWAASLQQLLELGICIVPLITWEVQ
jgi:hypothetical protein